MCYISDTFVKMFVTYYHLSIRLDFAFISSVFLALPNLMWFNIISEVLSEKPPRGYLRVLRYNNVFLDFTKSLFK